MQNASTNANRAIDFYKQVNVPGTTFKYMDIEFMVAIDTRMVTQNYVFGSRQPHAVNQAWSLNQLHTPPPQHPFQHDTPDKIDDQHVPSSISCVYKDKPGHLIPYELHISQWNSVTDIKPPETKPYI